MGYQFRTDSAPTTGNIAVVGPERGSLEDFRLWQLQPSQRTAPRDGRLGPDPLYGLASSEEGENENYEAGVDVRWRPSTRLGVDLTANPDFALVEADMETINLTRFELRIPEKRPFFLEGNEMYNQRIRQFYSRRIDNITWGAKTSGKLGDTDFSGIATSENIMLKDGLGEATANYTVARLQHGLARGSNVGLLAANRNFLGENAGSVGLDTTMYFTDTLSMTGQYLQVYGPTADRGLFVPPGTPPPATSTSATQSSMRASWMTLTRQGS